MKTRATYTLLAWLSVTGPSFADAGLADPTQPTTVSAYRNMGNGQQGWVLNSTLVGQGRRVAVINGTPVLEGERVGGAKLIRIKASEVQLQTEQGRLTLHLFDKQTHTHTAKP